MTESKALADNAGASMESTHVAQVSGIKMESSADSSQSLINTMPSGSAGMSLCNSGKFVIEKHVSGMRGHIADTQSSAINCGTVGNSSDDISGRNIFRAPVVCNGTTVELVTQGSVPLVTVANQMPYMTEQITPMVDAPHSGSIVRICVFSTELANCAAESVGTGHYDNIFDFHQDYSAVHVAQNQRNASCYMPANQSHINCYSEYQPSHSIHPAAVQEPAVGYAQTGVEQWVRQQNASRQKQEQMASLSLYGGKVYRTCDQSGQYQYWPGHQKPLSSVALARSNVDFVGPSGYGNMNVQHFHQENCKMADGDLTVEQRRQRQNKMGRLQMIRQMLTAEQQITVCGEQVDLLRDASITQSRVPMGISWNSVPCGSDVYSGQCNSRNNTMNNNYASSAVKHECYAPSWDAVTSQRQWYHMQHEHCVNKMSNFAQNQSSDLCIGDVRYFAPSRSPVECYQLSARGSGVMPVHAVCDCTPVYPSCGSQACLCNSGGVSSRTGMHHVHPSGMYGHTEVDTQPNYGCQQQMSRCNKFMNDMYVMPVSDSRQLAYSVPYRHQTDRMQNWNSVEDVMKQRVITAPTLQQFDAPGQQVTLTPQHNNYYGTDSLGDTVNTSVHCTPTEMQTVAVCQRQPSNSKKRKNVSSMIARPADTKLKKLDSIVSEWQVARSGTMTNITSASLAQLAKGVENISAIMQQTVQHGGPFQSVRAPCVGANVSDENANFISADTSLQTPGLMGKTPTSGATSITSPFSTVQTPASYSTCCVTAVSTLSHGNVCTAGVDVVVTSKAPYTISYRPSGISSEGDSQGTVDVRNASVAAYNHNAQMMERTYVGRHMSSTQTASSGQRYIASSEGFNQLSYQQQCGLHKNPADATKVDQLAASSSTQLPVADSLAVIQPHMMSGTRLFITDCSAPALNKFVLPSSTVVSPHSHSILHDPNYHSLAPQSVPVSVNVSDIPVIYSSSEDMKPKTDLILSSVCTSGIVMSQ